MKIEIYDPAMCCSTGVCGPSIDTELLRVSTVVDALKTLGVDITRYNLANEPQAFVENKAINDLLTKDNDILPITMLDGEIVKTKEHLTNEEFTKYTGYMIVNAPAQAPAGGCCGPANSGCC